MEQDNTEGENLGSERLGLLPSQMPSSSGKMRSLKSRGELQKMAF